LRSAVQGYSLWGEGRSAGTDGRAFLRAGRSCRLELDRLGRSLPHLIETVTTLEAPGIGFRSLTEAIDTTTSGGRLIFHIFGARGQFERDLIRERIRAGLIAAASRGRRGGRRPVITAEKLHRDRTLIEQGFSVREAAARIEVGKTALNMALGAKADVTAAK
jgi:DNA invertase Pin-like site-specific DNA recombinase